MRHRGQRAAIGLYEAALLDYAKPLPERVSFHFREGGSPGRAS